MPTTSGILTEEEKEQVAAKIRKTVTGQCPICGSRKWDLLDQVVAPLKFGAGGAVEAGGELAPQIMVVSECGFVAYFSAIRLGIDFKV